MLNLKEAIASAIEKMKKYRSLYEQNEMAVRSQIVEPILRSLGWDVENPEEVHPNVHSEEGFPDYLLSKDNKKVLFIEAKKLSIDMEKRDVINQLAKYCFGQGMNHGVVAMVLFGYFLEHVRKVPP